MDIGLANMDVKPSPHFEEQESSSSLMSDGNKSHRNEIHIAGAHTEIWLATAIVSIPMLALAAALLILTLNYRLDKTDPWFRSTDFANVSSDTSGFYLDMSSTRYVTVASWTSNIAPQLSAFILVLFSYRIAVLFVSALRRQTTTFLPTPYQFGLLIRAGSGGLTPFWFLGMYWWSMVRQKLSVTVMRTYLMLLLTLLLGYAVWSVDTWLHFTTSAINLSRHNANVSSYESYSRWLWCDPSGQASNEARSCSVNGNGLGMIEQAFLTLNNLSSMHKVSMFHRDNVDYAYLTSPTILKGVDYEAYTLAVGTKCQVPPRPNCSMEFATAPSAGIVQAGYYCNNFEMVLSGRPSRLGDTNTTIQFLNDSNALNAAPVKYSPTNPFSFATAAMTKNFYISLMNDPNLVLCAEGCTGVTGAPYINWMLNCTTTVYDLHYRWTNGSFGEVIDMPVSNSTVGVTVSTPFTTSAGAMTLFNIASTASSYANSTLLANAYALVFSKTALSLIAGVMEPSPNTGQGEPLLGTRVEKAPLFTLLALNCIYPVLAIILAIGALSIPDLTRVKDVQARIGVTALAAHCFEPDRAGMPVRDVDELYTERTAAGRSEHTFDEMGASTAIDGVRRVGIVETADGGWRYRLLQGKG